MAGERVVHFPEGARIDERGCVVAADGRTLGRHRATAGQYDSVRVFGERGRRRDRRDGRRAGRRAFLRERAKSGFCNRPRA